MSSNLDTIIRKFKKSCEIAKSEDDIKAAGNIFFNELGEYYKIEIRMNNEKTSICGGRADGVYNDIYFEYKDYRIFDKQRGVNEAVYGRDEKDRGIYHYLINFSLEECHRDKEMFEQLLTKKVGVGFDGKHFVICRFKKCDNCTTELDTSKTKNYPKGFPKSFPVEFEQSGLMDFEYGVKRLLLLVRSTNRSALTAQALCNTFSSNSSITKKTIRYLYELLVEQFPSGTNNTRIQTLYNEWLRIFGTIYEGDNTDFVKYENAIKMYSLNSSDEIDIKLLLFTIQTYYSIIIKLLIYNLFESLTSPQNKTSYIKDLSDLVALFQGSSGSKFNQYIDNFFEIHFFEWFVLAKDFDVSFINDILTKLDTFETTVSVIKPELVEDVLKKTYESIMPKEFRHMMGEYYTVNWLADFTIKHSGYHYGESESVLDPTCGSGTFITHLIKSYIGKFSSKMDYNMLVTHIVENFVGFDINPIAVIQAKGNYILSLGDITNLDEHITIPIYMCDSILVPTVYAKQRNAAQDIEISTSAADFKLPILKDRQTSDQFLKTLSECILKDYDSYESFQNRLKKESKISTTEAQINELSRNLFNQLLTLHLSGKDGFWPIILKNSFAPLFCKHKFDYVIGNPPWIAWKAMSDNYRQLTLDIWLSYGIFEKNAYDKKTSHDDFAMAVTYVAIDHYLKDNGRAAFILPQTFVKSSKGGEGFRKFCITRDKLSIPFAVSEVHDMLSINPFRGIASNKTSVYVFDKGKHMSYPMDKYFEYRLKEGEKILPEYSLTTVEQKLQCDTKIATPVNKEDIRSPWLTLSSNVINDLDKYLRKSEQSPNYSGRKGIEPCGAKGIYLLNVVGKKNSLLKIENIVERSRLQAVKDKGVHGGYVEPDMIYPMVGGRNIKKWGIDSYIYMIVPHESEGNGIYRGFDEEKLKSDLYHTYDWLYYFKDVLLETRIRSGKFFDEKQFPWYRLDNVGVYTFSKYKVLWQEQSKSMNCCVVSNITDEYVHRKTVVTDSKVLYVSTDNEQEAYYLCGILNSSEIEEIVKAYTIDTNRGIDIVKNIYIPKFDENIPLHVEIASASKEAHIDYMNKNDSNLILQEDIINRKVALLYK